MLYYDGNSAKAYLIDAIIDYRAGVSVDNVYSVWSLRMSGCDGRIFNFESVPSFRERRQ